MTDLPASLQRARLAALSRERPPTMRRQADRFSRLPRRVDPMSPTTSVVGQVAAQTPYTPPMPQAEFRAQQRRQYDALQQRPRAVEAYQAPRNQFAEAGEYGLEMTGLPSIRRSAAAFADNRPQEGFAEGAMGALSLATLGVGGRGARAQRIAPPMRAPVAEPSGALRPPPRQLGTASDGSVMPVRPPEPFRQSMVGGSDDLAEAARPGALRPAPDGSPSAEGRLGVPAPGNDYVENLRSQGFDVETPLYHGTSTDFDQFSTRGTEGAVFLSSDPQVASVYANRWSEGSNVRPVFIRPGRTLTVTLDRVPQPSDNADLIAQAKREGYDSIHTIIDTRGTQDRVVQMIRARFPNEPEASIRQRLGSTENEGVRHEWAILNPQNVAPRFGAPRARALAEAARPGALRPAPDGGPSQ